MKMVPWVVACKEVIFPSSLIRKGRDKRKSRKHVCVGFIAVVPVEKKCT
jgi:hypothetical protein